MSNNKMSDEHKEIIGAAEDYERDKVPSLFLPLGKFFLEHVPLQESASVLDVACGTGIIARLVSNIVGDSGTVVGVDIDSDMIEVAKKNTPSNKSITWHVGKIEYMPFLENASFDWVLCQQGFQYFHDKLSALREIYRVIKPNGGLAMIIARSVDKQNQPYQWARAEALHKHVSSEAGEKEKKLVPFFDGNEEDLRDQMTDVGFRKIDIKNVVKQRIREAPEKFVTEDDYIKFDPEIRKAIVADIRKAMEPFQTNDETTLVPYGFHIAIGYK